MYWDEASLTVSQKPSCSIHKGMNLNGMGPKSTSSSTNNEMGRWSKDNLGKFFDDIRKSPSNKEL